MTRPTTLKLLRETHVIENGRNLYRYTFQEGEPAKIEREDKGEIVDPSAQTGPEIESRDG